MTNDVRGLVNIEPQSVRDQVLHAYTRSIALIWYSLSSALYITQPDAKNRIIYCGCNFIGLLLGTRCIRAL